MLQRLLAGLAPVAALAMTGLAAGCGGVNVQLGDDGVPLAELDTSGAVPTELVLAGPDTVTIVNGSGLEIDVSGDQAAVDALRFKLEDGSLGISRDKDSKGDIGTASVRVTMPSLRAMVLAGSGTVNAEQLTGDAEVTIAGSGSARAASVRATKLDLTIAGSGDFEGAGEAETLDLTIAGAGSGRMPGLKVENADISVAGSGDAEFSSDGTVEARIMGSGNVTVNGSADCTITAMGSGTLRCRGGTTRSGGASGQPTPPEAPAGPQGPSGPTAPEPPAPPEGPAA